MQLIIRDLIYRSPLYPVILSGTFIRPSDEDYKTSIVLNRGKDKGYLHPLQIQKSRSFRIRYGIVSPERSAFYLANKPSKSCEVSRDELPNHNTRPLASSKTLNGTNFTP